MFNLERQQKILELLVTNSRVRVFELSELLEVSEATIRRDLEKLQESGRIARTHGGALLTGSAAPEPPVVYRFTVCADEKRRIGKAAAALIQDGDAVFIGTGTTAAEVAKNLIGRSQLTVVTNALTVLNVLANQEGITLISTGGLLRPSELSFVGHIADLALRELRPCKAIIGIRAITLEDGLTNQDVSEVNTDRVIIRAAPEIIVVADHSKFGNVSMALVAPVTAANKIVTDSGTPSEFIAQLTKLGIQVIVA